MEIYMEYTFLRVEEDRSILYYAILELEGIVMSPAVQCFFINFDTLLMIVG